MKSGGVDDAKEFLAMIAADHEIRDEVHRATDRVLEIAKQHGKNFSREDMATAIVEDWRDGDNTTMLSIVSEPPGE